MARSLAVLSLLLSCFFAAGLAVTCTEEHVGHTYTECTNGKRIATYYWSQPCEVGSYTLPSSIYNLPCDIECAAGQYLPFGGTQCLSCSKGKYSLGGGEVLSDWTRLPDRMSTDCTGNRCSAWTANGTYLESGYNYQRDNIQSNLRLFAKFLSPTGNLIRFSYTVDAESCYDCDGLMFYIDDQPMFTSLEPHQLRWATLEFNVSQGYHDFRWSYQKDYSISRGLDKVFIRSIELVGTTTAPEVCADCPAGTIGTNIGASQCTPCDYNTFSNPGQESCIPCLSNQYAFPGSPDCTNLVACQAKHIFSKRTPCNPATMTQNIEYHFITLGNGNVKVCDPANATSVSLPPTETNVPCVCPPGQFLDSNGACVHCPDGTARNSTQQRCEDCPIGTAALESLYLADWTTLPSKVQTFCQGECDAQGWIPRGDHIDTGYGSGRQFQSFLSISEIELKSRGAVSGFYTLASCPMSAGSPTCSLDLIFDNDQAEEVETRALAAGTNRTFSYILDPGNYTLTWRYTQRDTLITESTKVKLYRIIVSGVSEGGAPACILCPAGSGASQPKSSRCTICGPGFYSPTSGGTCLPADPGYIARGSNSTRQIPCGANTTPNPEHTDCLTDCTFTVSKANKTVRYDLNPLYSPESMNFAGTDNRNNQYFLNLCSREHNNASCFTAQGEPIPTFACQHVENWEFAVDLGNILGFVPSPEGNLSTFTVTMTEGAAACARVYNVSVPRATNITMICDLAAGLGAPRPSYGNGNVAEYPTPSCHYYFTWKSMYACPLCTSEDYQLTISDCVDGKKVKTFTRLTECFDPNPIPPEDIPCKLCPVENAKTCNAHGSCDDVSGACNCENSWAGDACELCSFGYYGENCLKECPGGAKLPCLGHGICSAGLNGNGSCACSTGWSGDLCDTCDSGFQGESCEAIPASVTDVVPWWGFVLIFGGLAIIVVSVIVLWKQKRNVEYKYSSLLKAQPLEMDDGDENVVGIPQDDSDPEGR